MHKEGKAVIASPSSIKVIFCFNFDIPRQCPSYKSIIHVNNNIGKITRN